MNYWRLWSLFANYLFNIIQITRYFAVHYTMCLRVARVITSRTTLITRYYFQLEKSVNDFARRGLIDSLTRKFHIESRGFARASLKSRNYTINHLFK